MINYVYRNVNPKQDTIEDCVTRAITTVTNLDYNSVVNLLNWTARVYGCDKLNVNCYCNLLSDIFQYKSYECYDNETVSYIAKCFPNSKLLIRIEGHLTCSLYGSVNDIWDCSNKIVDRFWVVR